MRISPPYPALDRLDQVRAIEQRSGPGELSSWSPAQPWLARGCVQEWFSVTQGPALGLLTHVARSALGPEQGGWVIWIGRSCWPYPPSLWCGDADRLLEQSIFVDPPDDAARLWSIDLAARSRTISAVVADGDRLGMAATRRLQLSARAGRSVVLLARSHTELGELSAASIRWLVRPALSPGTSPRWEVELLRCKGVRRANGMEDQKTWFLEWRDAQGLIALPADLRCGQDPSRAAQDLSTTRYAG